MHTTFKSTLFASSMLLSCALHAGVVDGINQTEMPAFGGDAEFGFSSIKWSQNEVYFKYIPSFDYTLTGLFTRFSSAGTVPHEITMGIYDYNPLGTAPGSGPLRSFTFTLVPGTFDIVPGPEAFLSGTDWLGNNAFAALEIDAGTPYYIELSGLIIGASRAGVNTVHVPDENTSLAHLAQSFSTTSVLTFAGSFTNSYQTDPIFKFEGTPVTPVPEPSTYGLIGAVGLLGFAAYRRRFGRKS